MKKVVLKYSTEKLIDFEFDDESENQILFETVKLTDLIPETLEETGILLNGRKYNHILHLHYNIDLTISANEITDIEFEFLKNFWTAKYKYISLLQEGVFSGYKRVFTEGGKLPITYIEEINYLKEVAFSLSADGW